MLAAVGQTYTGISSPSLTDDTRSKYLPYDCVRWKPLPLKIAWNTSTMVATTPENRNIIVTYTVWVVKSSRPR